MKLAWLMFLLVLPGGLVYLAALWMTRHEKR